MRSNTAQRVWIDPMIAYLVESVGLLHPCRASCWPLQTRPPRALARRVLRWLTDDSCVSSRSAYIDRMDSEKRIQAIVKAMGDGLDKIPLRRALRMCLQDLEALRAQGLTWGTIAMRMTKAGARHR